LVALSTLIAAFGLIMNSTAVVIGAMLVAPLMTPILGIALALVRGEPHFLGPALRAEIAGILVAVGASMLLGLAIPYFDATPEMLSRTTPNLLDLLVAVLAGTAGAFAMVDERVSPVLPGVAISTAIVPPLANVGLSASLGAWSGAWGSFLLFFTNFLSILLASSVVFLTAGMVADLGLPTKTAFARRFGLALVGFVVVAALLSVKLSEMVETGQVRSEIRSVLENELADVRITDLVRLVHQKVDDDLVVLVHVHAPDLLPPRRVEMIETRLEERLGTPVELFLRTTVTKDVAPPGTSRTILSRTLDGFRFGQTAGHTAQASTIAEQLIREYLQDRLGFQLERIKSVPWGETTAVFAEISGVRSLRQSEVAEIEQRLETRLDTPILLMLRQNTAQLLRADGTFRAEFAIRRPRTPEERTAVQQIREMVGQTLRSKGYSLTAQSVTVLEDGYYGLFETLGPRLFTPEELLELQRSVGNELDRPLHLFVRSVPEAVVSDRGYTTLDEVLASIGPRSRKVYEAETRALMEGWR
jgi:uncharacterized hydrophobic protein (TIGR00271 family)